MPKTVFQVATKAQLAALASPLRSDILDRLVAYGSLSVRDLAKALGRQPTAIYSHLQKLEKVGLIHSEDSKSGEPGRPGRVYKPAGDQIRLTQAARRPENRKLVEPVVRAAGKQAARDFIAALSNPKPRFTGSTRNHGFYRAVSAPSPKRLARINALLEELIELTWSPDPNPGPVISFAWFLAPLEE